MLLPIANFLCLARLAPGSQASFAKQFVSWLGKQLVLIRGGNANEFRAYIPI